MIENQNSVQRQLVLLAQAMLDGELSFFEGAAQVVALKRGLIELTDRDPDFDVFFIIQSETDHLPLESQRAQWSPTALAELGPEFERTEDWAKTFAPKACENLIQRFKK
ncbi:DUF2489 domain-containing protein [Variovorax humicola]|uniref:DUF2489 domain-containing protein n=1 Tax=Variovorax humicola TaxID=1769758 RepID=A0ABU8WDE9_9BURK